MNDNISQVESNVEGEWCIYIIWARGTLLYNIGFTRGKPEAQLNQLNIACPYPVRLLQTYPCNNHEVFESIDDLKEIVYRALFLNRKNGDWFELNTYTLEKAKAIFKAVDIESTLNEQKEGAEALRYLSEKLIKHADTMEIYMETKTEKESH